MKTLADQIILEIKNIINKNYNGNIKEASKYLDVNYQTLYKWLSDERKPGLAKLEPVLMKLGGKISFSDIPSKEVCFVDAKIVNAEDSEYIEKPEAEDYLAVPVVDEVGAGPGIIPQNQLLSWFLVYRHQPAVRYRINLLAVQIGKNSTSMLPTLKPLDIVLIDRDDKDVKKSGRMFLVMDKDGAGKIKRVAVEDIKNDCRIIYYSDNAADNPPEIYSLKEDFFGDWNKCIVGKVIWAWSDVSEK